MNYTEMNESVERRQNAKLEPDTYGFEGDSFDELHHCMSMAKGKEGRKVFLRLGRKTDGMPEMWWHVVTAEGDVGDGNVSFNCPPRPPEDCEQ